MKQWAALVGGLLALLLIGSLCGTHPQQVAMGVPLEPLNEPLWRQGVLPVTFTPQTTQEFIREAVWPFEGELLVTFPPLPTLETLVAEFFAPEDRPWALGVAFCESSATSADTDSSAYHPSSGASGWFQHLPKFWGERTGAAGIPGSDIFDPRANVMVAAYLLYETPQGSGHWYPSEHCWN